MSIVTGIQTLSQIVDRLPAGGYAVAAELVQQMGTIEGQAREQSFEDLVQLCREATKTIQTLVGNEQLIENAERIEQHLREVCTFVAQWAECIARGDQPVDVRAPKPLAIADANDEAVYAETVGMFVGSALGALSDLEEELLSVESAGERLGEVLTGIRRTVHTLKAEFGVLNMLGPQALCHQAETMIDAIQEHGAPFPVDTMLAFGDMIKRFVESLATDVKSEFGDAESMLATLCHLAQQAPGQLGDDDEPVELRVDGDYVDSLPEFIGEARSHLADAEVAMVELSSHTDHDGCNDENPGSDENLNLTFRAFHTIKGVAAFLNLNVLVELAHVAETLLDGARSARFRLAAQDIDLVLAAGDMITKMIDGLEGQTPPSRGDWRDLINRLQTRAARSSDVAQVGLAAAFAEPAVQLVAPHDATPLSAAVVTPPAPVKAGQVQVRAARVERTIKVSTTRLDLLVDMVGELVIAQSMVLQDPAIQCLEGQTLARNIGQVGKITRDLQEAAMSLRMVTVKSTFQKMARLVRDVAGKSGKRVALSIAGEDTELDRNVVEQVSDPLVHMIRNAIDHGIEAPADRLAIGKDEEGQLSLSAYHQGGSIVIEIRDDGRGLDRDKVFAKAVSKGLLGNDVSAQAMSDFEVFNLIFLPGFSTAETITDLSGRGVGMDVVRRNIEALRGKIEIDSTLGKGTTFRLRLPLTLAIIDGMIVRVGESRYVVPTLSIEQSFRPNTKDVHHVVDRGECVHVRGAVLPIFRLKEIFDQPSGCTDLSEGILIVVEVDGQRNCLFVDEIIGQQQVVIKSLGMSRDRIVGLSGGAIMTDGRVALILDVGTLVESVLSA
tara:strand:+ start:421 stop:2931 length:2511 start_codon:yes stop_codon:yes gene_type:complete